METNIAIICDSQDIFPTDSNFSFGFSLKDRQGSNIRRVFKIHVAHKIADLVKMGYFNVDDVIDYVTGDL